MASSQPKTTKSAADENTPLLFASDASPATQANEEVAIAKTISNGINDETEDEGKPLPALQIFLLCYARMIEPIAFFGIFPFINKMIWETGGLKEEDVGFYSGLIESLFSLTQMLLMISWGRAADRIGRKPVLVFSLGGIAIATAVFGLSKAIWQMVFFRCCAGIFAGSIVTLRTMITENSTPKTQARAFSFFAFTGNVGIFLGPLLGGGLSNPADQYPKIFGQIAFFKQYPYALSTFATGSMGAIAAIICGLFIKETLVRKDKNEAAGAPPMKTWELIKTPGVPTVLFLYGHVMLLGMAYTAVVCPVFWFTQPKLGGYGFTPIQISMFLAGIGVSQAFWLLVVFPPLHHRYGTGGILRGCLYVWPIFLASAPLCNIFLRNGWTTAFWITAPILQIGGSGVAMAFTAAQLALNDISPSHQTLGTLNALALTITSGIRAFAPALYASLFAIGARTQILNGHMVWVALVATALLGTVTVSYLPEKAEGKPKKKPVEE
ncbi:hypothetical protein G7Y89_g3719 [Cudoniella acicularis]|uniref:Major facilitator superfamily (MFS) profile domain-containing protein n=1 Tax=Cudoniella acicularis TaxID=354080 RepID=A0A8H4W840_9HELO|nr:hypothetical protein G7Y89_g3719 [Cudoniella acicularis]